MEQVKYTARASSEDPKFKAADLSHGKAWKTNFASKREEYVVLELEHATKIDSISFVNQSSEFASVSVGETPEHFEPLVNSKNLMS